MAKLPLVINSVDKPNICSDKACSERVFSTVARREETVGNTSVFSLQYAVNKTKKTKDREAELEYAISKLELKMENGDSSETENFELVEQLNDLKSELERIIEFRTKGSILRAKIKWHNEGEKNTKYFLNLEKRHYKQGIISQLKVDENNFITSDQEILAEG